MTTKKILLMPIGKSAFRRTIKVGGKETQLLFPAMTPTEVTPKQLEALASDIGAGLGICQQGDSKNKLDMDAISDFCAKQGDLALKQEKPAQPLSHQQRAIDQREIEKQASAAKSKKPAEVTSDEKK